MFTGIIEEIGTIDNIQRGTRSAVLTIRCEKVLAGTRIGDSIAVNGVCLTVTGMSGHSYTADVMAETIDRSSLGSLKKGSRVNLERAMPMGGRFGGHIVAGHIDGVGKICEVRRDETAVWYRIQASGEILRYVVAKGSVAIDGISLTVAVVTDTDFSVSVIPHTQAQTNLADRRVGDQVNLECDVIGKYVEKLCRPRSSEGSVPVGPGVPGSKEKSRLTESFLMENGFW